MKKNRNNQENHKQNYKNQRKTKKKQGTTQKPPKNVAKPSFSIFSRGAPAAVKTPRVPPRPPGFFAPLSRGSQSLLQS